MIGDPRPGGRFHVDELPPPPADELAAETDLAVLASICKAIGGHYGEGRLHGTALVGRCQFCGLGLYTDGT